MSTEDIGAWIKEGKINGTLTGIPPSLYVISVWYLSISSFTYLKKTLNSTSSCEAWILFKGPRYRNNFIIIINSNIWKAFTNLFKGRWVARSGVCKYQKLPEFSDLRLNILNELILYSQYQTNQFHVGKERHGGKQHEEIVALVCSFTPPTEMLK